MDTVELLKRLTEEDKDEIILRAIQVCKWVGWMSTRGEGVLRGGKDVEALKEEIEKRSSMSLEEYT